MSIEEEFTTEKEKVRHILEEDKASRNSDKRLYAKRLQMETDYFITNIAEIQQVLSEHVEEVQGGLGKLLSRQEAYRLIEVVTRILVQHLNTVPNELDELPNWLTVRRVRAEIQNDDGELLPTDPEVGEMRHIREEEIREYYGWKKEDEG